jgi:hypothetical protein
MILGGGFGMAALVLIGQAGLAGSLGYWLIVIVVLCALWAALVVCSRYFSLPPLVMQLAGIVVAAIVCVLVIRILLSLL